MQSRLLRLCSLAVACGLLAGCGSSSKVAPVRGSSLVLVDSGTNEIVGEVAVGDHPTRVAYGDGAFWVVSPEAGVVVRVDAETKAAKRFRLGEEPYDAAVGGSALWVPDHDGKRLLRLDLESHALRRTQGLGLPAISVGFGFGSAWVVVADGTLLRIEPATLRVTQSIPHATTAIEGSEPKLAFDRGFVWISSPAESTVERVDPRRGTIERRMLIGATGISAGGGAVWVADDADAVWQLGRRDRRFEVGAQPHDVAATATGVWVAEAANRTLVRLDPSTGHVLARIELRKRPVAVAAGAGAVAVATERASALLHSG